MKKYSATRLLGDHVPYAIEAWPEGSQRHLSAESALYARIITEGIFGIRPTGFKSFTLTPRLPQEWPQMSLKKIGAFNAFFDIDIKRLANGKLEVTVTNGTKNKKYVIKEGQDIKVRL
jgi:cellobiose phosphorylase